MCGLADMDGAMCWNRRRGFFFFIFSSICARSGIPQRVYAGFFPPLIALTAFSKIQNMDPFIVGDHTLMIGT